MGTGTPACDVPDGPTQEHRSHEYDEEVVYESIRHLAADGSLLDFEEQGTWSFDLAERVARPWLHVEEGLVHDELAWHIELPDGTMESGYRVTAVPIGPLEAPPPDPNVLPEPVLSDAFAETLSTLDAHTEVAVLVGLAGWSSEPLPWVPHRNTVSAEDYEAFLAEMQAAAHAQRQAFRAAAAPLASAIEDAGGTIDGYLSTGSIAARIPAGEIASLATHPDVRRVHPDSVSDEGGHNPSHLAGDPVPLGDLRVMTGAQDYIDVGYDGKTCPVWCIPGFHLGVIETTGYQDNACYQGWSSCNPTTRRRRLFECNAWNCTPVTGFSSNNQDAHGTIVTSIAMGDYSDGQASGHESSIAPGLSAGWEDKASGFAKRGGLDYYAAGASQSTETTAFDCARGHTDPHANCLIADVINYSKGHQVGWCNAASWQDIEGAVEDVYDAGVLPVIITMNHNGFPDDDACRVNDPADIPKALAVGALEPSASTAYRNWSYVGYSNRGGGPSKFWLGWPFFGWFTDPTAMSMVDLVASGRPGYVTYAADPFGMISVDGPVLNVPQGESPTPFLTQGTSFAGPQVAGSALLVKHRHTSLGMSWINNPGRLHAVMLSMGDRATLGTGGATIASCISGRRIRCGADRYYGLGRLTLRRHPWLWMRTRTFTSSSPEVTKEIWSSALGSSARLVKCVMQQREDMVNPNKDNISRIGLEIVIRSKNAQGNCAIDQGQVLFTVSDNWPDDKHMVAVTDGDLALANRCVQLNFTKHSLSTAGSVTTHTYCVRDTVLDYDE